MVNSKISAIFLFPGQGAQYPLMAMDLLEAHDSVQRLFKTASQAAGQDLEALLRNSDADTLKRTDVSQPAITIANLAAATVLQERGISPMACAGFSLGEYAALAIAGVLSVEDCMALVSRRGAAMQRAADRITQRSAGAGGSNAPGMAAVLGLSPDQVEALLAQWSAEGLKELYAANFNSPKQVVVAGTSASLAEAEKRFKEAGARRVLRLPVAGPFHSPLIAEAAEEFGPLLEAITFKDPQLPLFSNVTGKRVSSGAEAKALALKQITSPVRWTVEEAAIGELNPPAVLEVGPGKVLQGLWKDYGSPIPCYSSGSLGDIEAVLTALIHEYSD